MAHAYYIINYVKICEKSIALPLIARLREKLALHFFTSDYPHVYSCLRCNEMCFNLRDVMTSGNVYDSNEK